MHVLRPFRTRNTSNVLPLRRPELRVLFVSHSFPPEGDPPAVGGMQRVAVELHEALQQVPGVALRSVLLRARRPWFGLVVVPFVLSLLGRIPRASKAHRPHVVVFSSMVTALLAWPLRQWLRRAGVTTAAIVHGLDVTNTFPTYQWLVRRTLASLDLVLPVSRSTAALCVARGAAAEKVEVVPNGVSLQRFFAERASWAGASGDGAGFAPEAVASGAQKRAAREVLAHHFDAPELLDEGTTLICSVGRQVPRKGFEWFAEHVIPLLPPDVHYWLAGDGPQAEPIRAAAEAAGVADRVRLLGMIDEEALTELLRAADLFAMPNRPTPNDPEGFGVVMLEAGLCGTPTVAAALEGIRDVIAEGKNGHLVPTGDADAFASTILRYHYDSTELHALARRTVRHTASTYDWASVAASYTRILCASALPSHEAASLHQALEEEVLALEVPTYAPLPAWVPAAS